MPDQAEFRICRNRLGADRCGRALLGKRLSWTVQGRLTGVSGIEAVFSAHVGDERKVLAASDQTDNGGRHSVAAYLCFDDISLSATIRGIGTLSVYGRTVVDRALGDHCWKFCPMVFRRPGIAQRQRHRIHNHFLLFRGEIALADADAGGGRWRFARCKGSLSGGAL